MPNYTFSYFCLRARGEVSRLLFAAAGVDYEDARIKSEDWPTFKPKTPQGQVPVLTIDGKIQITQSNSIARYLAREFGLAGDDNLEQARVDELAETSYDFITEQAKLQFASADQKDALKKKMIDETIPRYGSVFEKFLKRNNGGDGYFVGSKLTLGDLAVFAAWDKPVATDAKVLDKYPKLSAHRTRVSSTPNVAKYLKKRPDYDF